MSKNGRLYLRKIGSDDVLPPPPIPERPANTQFRILEMGVEELSRVMTLLDYELFSRIDPLEFLYGAFKTKDKNIANLNTFNNRFNEVPSKFWIFFFLNK